MKSLTQKLPHYDYEKDAEDFIQEEIPLSVNKNSLQPKQFK